MAGNPHGKRNMKGPKPKIKNPGKLFARLMGYIMKKYTFHLIIVVICIFVGVLANVRGTLFMQELIDDYIKPLLTQPTPDFSPLKNAIIKVCIFYAIGIISTALQSQIMPSLNLPCRNCPLESDN